jgi:hypothetical protein
VRYTARRIWLSYGVRRYGIGEGIEMPKCKNCGNEYVSRVVDGEEDGELIALQCCDNPEPESE